MKEIDTRIISVKENLEKLLMKVKALNFSEDSIIELGAIKLEAERITKKIGRSRYGKFCLNELKQVDSDEFYDMFKRPSKETFTSAQCEFEFILKDCIAGRING